jgi:hypothetical protein
MRPRSVALVVLVACGIALVACAGPSGTRSEFTEKIYQLASSAEVGDTVDLEPAFGASWDRIVLFDGDPGEATIRDVLGFDWPGYSPGMGDGTTVTLIRGDSVASWGYIPAINDATVGRLVEFEMVEPWIEVDPTNAEFVVEKRSPAGPVRLCYLECPQPEG